MTQKTKENQSLSHVPAFPTNTYPAGMTADCAGLSRQELAGISSPDGDELVTPTTSIMLEVRGIPRAKGRGRNLGGGRVVSTVDPKENLWRAAVERAAREAVQNVGPISGAVRVDLVFRFPTTRSERWGRPHTPRPDKDNLEKLALDAFTRAGLIACDDSNVAAGEVVKLWAEAGGMVARLSPLSAEPVETGASLSAIPDWLRGP